ncbi:MAG: CBS domain-containing protein [Pyrobaculum sp.]
MKIRELIRKPPLTITPNVTLLEAADLLAKHSVGALVVVNPENPNMPMAVLSERDIVRAISMRMPLSTPVEAFMSTTLVTIGAEEPVEKAAELMWINNIRHLVVTEGGKMVGVVSIRDIINPQALRQICR